jgi:hypothetical protein
MKNCPRCGKEIDVWEENYAYFCKKNCKYYIYLNTNYQQFNITLNNKKIFIEIENDKTLIYVNNMYFLTLNFKIKPDITADEIQKYLLLV